MSKMVLLGTSWKKFKMDNIFVFHKGKRLTKEDMNPGNTNFIAAIDDNNGIRQKIDLPPLHNGNCITVNYNGSIGESFYQDQPFRASDDVNILYPKNWELTKNIGLFLCTVIRHNKYRFGYGRKWNLEKMKDTNIALPVDKNGSPDWDFMDSYIGKLTKPEKIKTKIKHKELLFDTTEWQKFNIKKIFECKTTKPMIETVDGDSVYITRSSVNNGVSGFVSDEGYNLNKANCITIGAEGRFAFYQDKDFVAGVKIYTLRNKKLNKYNGLFICTILNQDVYKYSYGRARILSKIKQETIKLPVDKNGNPDWDYMEKYIKSLPYSDLI